MRDRLPLPRIVDVGVLVTPERTSCELDVFTAKQPTRDDAESMRRAFAPTLCQTFRDVQLCLEHDLADAAKERPQLDYADPLVRSVLATVISVAHRPRLLRYAERCMARAPRELPVDSEDLLELALVLLLVGKPKWRGSLEQMLSSLCTAMRNLSLNPQRAAARLEEFVDAGPGTQSTNDDPDREGFRVLLRSDVKVELESLPEPQKAAVVACWMNGESAAEFSAAEGRSAPTVRVQLHRAKPVLQKALKSYAPPGFFDPGATPAETFSLVRDRPNTGRASLPPGRRRRAERIATAAH